MLTNCIKQSTADGQLWSHNLPIFERKKLNSPWKANMLVCVKFNVYHVHQLCLMWKHANMHALAQFTQIKVVADVNVISFVGTGYRARKNSTLTWQFILRTWMYVSINNGNRQDVLLKNRNVNLTVVRENQWGDHWYKLSGNHECQEKNLINPVAVSQEKLELWPSFTWSKVRRPL